MLAPILRLHTTATDTKLEQWQELMITHECSHIMFQILRELRGCNLPICLEQGRNSFAEGVECVSWHRGTVVEVGHCQQHILNRGSVFQLVNIFRRHETHQLSHRVNILRSDLIRFIAQIPFLAVDRLEYESFFSTNHLGKRWRSLEGSKKIMLPVWSVWRCMQLERIQFEANFDRWGQLQSPELALECPQRLLPPP